MKRTILLLTVSLATALGAPAQTPVSAANLGLRGFNNSFGPFFNNQLPNGSARNLNQLLLNLQVDLAQILPVLTTVNDNFDFTFVGTNAVVGGGIVGVTGPGVPLVNSGTATASTAITLGTSLGQDLTVTGGGQANAVTPGSTALGGSSLAITPIAGSNASSAATGTASATAPTLTSRREVLRALLLLQDNVEQMLPLVNGLNGGNATTLNASTTLTPTGR